MNAAKITKKSWHVSIRTTLGLLLLVALGLAALVRRADSRRLQFDAMREDGAIVTYSNQPPKILRSIADIDWGPIFDRPELVAYYLRVEGKQVRIGDRLFTPDDGECYLLKQKSIANAEGAKNIRFYIDTETGANLPDDIVVRMLLFGDAEFPYTGTQSWSMYKRDWKLNVKRHQRRERGITKR